MKFKEIYCDAVFCKSMWLFIIGVFHGLSEDLIIRMYFRRFCNITNSPLFHYSINVLKFLCIFLLNSIDSISLLNS